MYKASLTMIIFRRPFAIVYVSYMVTTKTKTIVYNDRVLYID
jgi:hypothetical protein